MGPVSGTNNMSYVSGMFHMRHVSFMQLKKNLMAGVFHPHALFKNQMAEAFPPPGAKMLDC